MADMAEKKTATISGRLSGELRRRLTEITRKYGPSDARMLDDALSALADYAEKNEAYLAPMKMEFDHEADELARLTAAEAGDVAAPFLAKVETSVIEAELRRRKRRPKG